MLVLNLVVMAVISSIVASVQSTLAARRAPSAE
jgi:hypothetical protein